MDATRAREMWPKFDALIEQAESRDAKATIGAIKLIAEMLQSNSSSIDHMLGVIVKK